MGDTQMHREIEVRFLEIDRDALIQKLKRLGAVDQGEDFLKEIIFYDKGLTWQKGVRKLVRVRKTNKGTFVTYKHQAEVIATGTEEIEFRVEGSIDSVTKFLERVGLVAYRHQEKRRHTFILGDVTVDIDTWPQVPTYLEIEGPSEDALKDTAAQLGLDWKNAVFENPSVVINKYYGIPVETLRYFTFDRVE